MKREGELLEEVKRVDKMANGYYKFASYCDAVVMTIDGIWTAHSYFLLTRSEQILNGFKRTVVNGKTFKRISLPGLYGSIQYTFLRWLYTDCVELEKCDVALCLLNVACRYKLPTLFERCEQAIVGKIDLTSCARIHAIAVEPHATTIIDRCKRLITQYFNKDVQQSPDYSNMDVDCEVNLIFNFSHLGEHHCQQFCEQFCVRSW